jgi:tetratricopeptide (TPR) repeat protein
VKKAEYSIAIAPLRQTLALEAGNDAARRALVVALVGTENFKDATRELALLLAKAPHDAALLETATKVFLRQGRYTEAVTVSNRRLALPDVTASLWAQYGDALDGASRTPEAAEAYQKAVALEPTSTLFRYALGYLYWKLYRYEEAERELVEVLKQEKDNARAAFTLGDLYLTRGDALKALPFLTQAAAAYPHEFDTRFALGRGLIITGDTERGITELRAAVKIDDTIADGHFQLGRALQKAGMKEEARRELDRARVLHDAKRQSEVPKPD